MESDLRRLRVPIHLESKICISFGAQVKGFTHYGNLFYYPNSLHACGLWRPFTWVLEGTTIDTLLLLGVCLREEPIE